MRKVRANFRNSVFLGFDSHSIDYDRNDYIQSTAVDTQALYANSLSIFCKFLIKVLNATLSVY